MNYTRQIHYIIQILNMKKERLDTLEDRMYELDSLADPYSQDHRNYMDALNENLKLKDDLNKIFETTEGRADELTEEENYEYLKCDDVGILTCKECGFQTHDERYMRSDDQCQNCGEREDYLSNCSPCLKCSKPIIPGQAYEERLCVSCFQEMEAPRI